MKKFVAVMICLCLSLMGMSVRGAEVFSDKNVKSITFTQGRGGEFLDSSIDINRYDFTYTTDDVSEIQGIFTYLNSMGLIDDGTNEMYENASDVFPSVLTINYQDGT